MASVPVVELSRFRAGISRGRRLRRADMLFAAPDPTSAIRALPGDEFFYVIHELGFPDAIEIMRHGTPEQMQAALDLALWDRDQIDPDAAATWLAAMSEVPADALARWARGIDIELLALLLRRRCRVYDLSLEEPPDEPQGTLYSTPDGFFVLDLFGEEDAWGVTARLLDALYSDDLSFMRKLLVGTRADFDAELEEQAYTWRSGRMADLGFVDYYAALEVYRELDPQSVRPGGPLVSRVRPLGDEETPSLRLPSALVETLASGSPFGRASAGVSSPEELANLYAALVALSNRVLAADRVTPGDDQAVTAVLARMVATLDLSIEFLAHGKSEIAVLAVQTVPVVQLFRLGVSLIGKVRKLATTLTRKTPFARLSGQVDLFETEDAEVLAACGRLRPLFPRALDTPPAAGERPFATLADLLTATTALEKAAAAVTWLLRFGVRPEDLGPERLPSLGVQAGGALDAGLLARTLLARELLEQPRGELRALEPDALAELEQLLARLCQAPELAAAARLRLEERSVAIWGTPAPSASARAVLARWIDELLSGNLRLVLARQ
jgi:hypothetical protein